MSGPSFRAGVVIVVRRSDGDVLAFERADVAGSWQLPQGGLDEGETPLEAAWRELEEETGLGAGEVRFVGEHPEWTVYELPPASRRPARLGQVHRWFFFEVIDDNVVPTPDGHEFVDWRWMSPADLLDTVVEFRRPSYRQVLG